MCNCRQGTGLHDHLGDDFMRDSVFGIGSPLNQCVGLNSIQQWNARTAIEAARCVFDPDHPANHDPLCSDEDPELLLFVPLSSVCQIKGISILGTTDDFAPSQVKIFVNPTEVRGFDSVRRLLPQEDIPLALTSADDRVVYRVNATKFASVNSLAIFFDHSFSDDETHLLRIELFGENTGRPTAQGVVTNVVYEGRANPADHPVEDEKRNFFASVQ